MNDPGQKTQPSKPGIIGTMIGGRYLVERELGRGGIGAVYLARDKPEMMSRRVVIKILLEDSLRNEWVVQKFHQEIESLTRLDDAGVVGVFDAGKLEDGSPYLVMQFVDGVSLRTEIRQGGMDLVRSAKIIQQVGRTLHAAHAKGIIHRDLKPENIMLRRTTAGDEQVKVIDFGIAKVKNSVVAPSTVTGVASAGTIGYMPPEQLQAQSITPASDIYALGAVAYEMLTGVRPFNPETGYQLLEMQREGVRVRPKDLRPAVPARAEELILSALAFDPTQRYQDAARFGHALANALQNIPDPHEVSTAGIDISGNSIPATKNVTDSTLRNIQPVPVAGRTRDAESQRSETETKIKRRFPAFAVVGLLLVLLAGIAIAVWAPWKRNQPSPALANRTLTYFLTVQKMVKDPKTDEYKPLGDPFASSGQEIYGNGWEFQINITGEQSGSLYILNEGAGAGGAVVYNALFPTPANNNGVAQLAAGQTMRTGQYFFNEYKGIEKVWIVWSAQPLAELESIFKEAADYKLVINRPTQMKTVRDLLAKYESSKPEVQTDKSRKLTTVKGTGDVLVSLLELQHEQY